ncbi:hypothetical protein [Nocardioides sp.]|uniref:hypothetical protein n=1 Tax=Nocardioides sp. TaxID=35761 RepID=UPI002724D527|nr:hypothetical protein [Nocardioides sp.]MDO9456027.1 hypothetical protein [Nocardioides sp.]
MDQTLTSDVDSPVGVARRRWVTPFFALLLVASTCLAGLVLLDFNGYNWGSDRLVPQDGQPHTVEVGDAGLVWAGEWEVTPDCVATDGPEGPPLALTGGGGARHGGGGKLGDYVATWRAEPTSGRLTVTCTSSRGSTLSPVAVTDDPWGPAQLSRPVPRAATLLLSLLLVGLSLAALTRRRRPEPDVGHLSIFDAAPRD